MYDPDSNLGYDQLGGLWSTVVAASGSGGGAIMLMGARAGDGVSELAVGLARMAAERVPNAAWLLDLDLYANKHFEGFHRAGIAMAGPFDMTFGMAPFWRTSPQSEAGSARGAIVAHRLDGSRLFVSRFDRNVLREDQTLRLAPAAGYWSSARQRIDLTVVDAPPLERSRAGLALVSDMDGVILVVDGAGGDPADAAEMRDEVLARGGKCLGVVVTTPHKRGLFSGFGARPKAGARSMLAAEDA